MRFSSFAENREKQLNGAPIPIGVAVFHCKRWGTKESDDFIAKLRRELFGPFTSNDEQYFPELIAHWLAEYAITGWVNVYKESENENDSELQPYSKKIARQVFLDESQFLSLNTILFQQANNYENYLNHICKEDSEEIKK